MDGAGSLTAIVAALVVALIGIGCVIIRSFEKKASCEDVHADELFEALTADSTLTVTPVASPDGRSVTQLDCVREGIVVTVRLREDLGVLSVSANDVENTRRRPEQWKDAVEYVCARLDAQFSGLGPWKVYDRAGRAGPWLFACLLAFSAFLGAMAWFVWWLRRNTRPAPLDAASPPPTVR